MYDILLGMKSVFNTAEPCNPAWRYMLPVTERLPRIKNLF